MAPAVRRRLTPIDYARQLVDAIIYIRNQKQIPNFERISRHMQRHSEITPRRCKEHLNNAVSDGLIMEYTAVCSKGANTGQEQEGYRLSQANEIDELDDGHDWYCFECHGPGEVHECNTCFRVYHQGCTRDDTTGESFSCSICRTKEAGRKKHKMRKKMLNTLLSYTILQLKEKTKELYKIASKVDQDHLKRFVFKKMDLHRMEQKVQASRYKCLDEFHADSRIILHNCTLLFGVEKGGMTELATVMVNACKYDIEEIDLCANCYYMSNAKPEDWFCQPCNPAHDLVFAKQKGYFYWPAKIVKDLGGMFDVRFFGGWHQRAVIPAEYIKPITTEVKSMGVKKTGGFNNAMKELKRHQKLLEERERELEATNGTKEEEEDEEEEEDSVEDEEMKDNDIEENDKATKDDDDEMEEEMNESAEEAEPKKHNDKAKPKGKVKTPGKKGVKRPREEDAYAFEDELDTRQVTSTSVDKNAKKRKRNSTKVMGPDESIQVTSSVDKITPSPPIATMNAGAQTTIIKMEHSSVQTDAVEEKPVIKEDVEEKTVEEKQTDDFSEDRMAKVIADLTQRLEEKFEDEKNKALKELSERLEEDFGKDKQQAVERTLATMKQEVEKARKVGEDTTRAEYMEEMKKLATRHKEAISQAKKKQWCFNCGEESMYHCCWNTSYCSLKCQQEHWHKEHKRVCRRKRPVSSS